MTAKKKSEFMPEAAYHYAVEVMGWKLPKKLKSPEVLEEIVGEHVMEMVRAIPEEERYGCEACDSTVGEPDDFCWYCGADISDPSNKETSGGFHPKEPLVFEEDKKKGEKKKEEKKKDSKKDKKKKDEKKALVTESEAQVFKSLKEYTKAIEALGVSAGESAWKVGKYLLEIKEGERFREGGYETMADYVKSELDYTWQMARNHMRYSSLVDAKQAALLGVRKIEILSRCSDESRDVFLKAALPKSAGGHGMSREQLEEKLREEREKVRESGKKVDRSGRGRKHEPNKKITLHDLIGETYTVRVKESEGAFLLPDSHCSMEIKVLKSSVKVAFYQAESAEE